MGVMDDLRAKEPEIRKVEFCLDHDLAERLGEVRMERDRLRRQAARESDIEARAQVDLQADEAEEKYQELAARVEARLVRFTMAAVDPETFDRLKSGNRPTDRQRTDARKAGTPPPDWNTDTFPQAMVVAACIKVSGPSGEQEGLSEEEVAEIWTSPNWNESERAELGNAAMAAYLTRTRLELPPKVG